MSKIEKIIGLERINAIFRALERGRTSNSDLEGAVKTYEEKRLKALERGNASEEKVIDCLSCLPEVEKVRRMPQFSKPDKKQIDLKVLLDCGLEVNIQVKSSKRGVEKFRRHIAWFNLLGEDEIDDWLVEHRMIVLIGREDKEKIVESFRTQVNDILYY